MTPSPQFRRGVQPEPSRVNTDLDELVALSPDEKEGIVRDILDDLDVSVKSYNASSGEMIIPCTVSDYHSNQNTSPTASINTSKMLFHCVGCGAGGTILWYVGTALGMESEEALGWLRERSGTGTRETSISRMFAFFEHITSRPETKAIPTYSTETLKPWLGNHEYFQERHISPEVVEAFLLGYGEFHDRVRNVSERRVVVPHFWEGKLVGWQSRALDPSPQKYKNSVDFSKGSTIYNYRLRKDPVVVESIFSVLRHVETLHMESTFGAKVTDRQLDLLGRHSTVTLWMDNDTAGWRATDRMIEKLARVTRVLVVPSTWVQDPGDLPTEEVVRLVDEAVPYMMWERPEKLWCFNCKSPDHGKEQC